MASAVREMGRVAPARLGKGASGHGPLQRQPSQNAALHPNLLRRVAASPLPGDDGEYDAWLQLSVRRAITACSAVFFRT
jgi:hypothetical protein